MKNTKKGITLVALVITIIIMLILVGIVITLIIGENGLIAKAQMAGQSYLTAQNQEKQDISKLDNEIGDYLQNSRDTVTMPAPKLLWQNPDPTNTNGFAAQTVTLEENNCDIIEIYYWWNIANKCILSQKLIINNKGRLFVASPAGSGSGAGTVSSIRDVVFNTNTSVTFEDAGLGHTKQLFTKDNSYIVPIYILGYETGLFSQEN